MDVCTSLLVDAANIMLVGSADSLPIYAGNILLVDGAVLLSEGGATNSASHTISGGGGSLGAALQASGLTNRKGPWRQCH